MDIQTITAWLFVTPIVVPLVRMNLPTDHAMHCC